MIRPSLLILCLPFSAEAEVVTAVDPFVKMPEGKTVVWSPLFQATWDAMNEKMGGKPQKVEPRNELMARLDDFKWDAAESMPEAGWKTWAGPAGIDFLETVNREAMQMTGEEEGPFTLADPIPGSLACFGLLDRAVEFDIPFIKSSKVALAFGKEKEPVRFFGATEDQAASYGKAVKVLAYRTTDGSRALEVSCKDGDDKVIFYIPPAKQDFATACRWLREWRKNYEWNAALPGLWSDRLLHEGDEVRVPYVSLDLMEDLTGHFTGDRFYGRAGDPWIIRRAEQRTKFELFEKGAKVRVEASLEVVPFAGYSPTNFPRRFVFDRPFFIFLWREKAEWPYLGVWVGDASALRKF